MNWPKDEDFGYPVELEFKPNPILGGIKDRGRSILPDGRELVADIYVSDWSRRTWRERILSWPWRPWVRTKFSPTAYVVGTMVLVSFDSYARYKSGEFELP